MFENTGAVSFTLYGVFIVITLIALVISFYLILKGSIDPVKLDKMIDLFKYSVVSVAIATVTLIVSDLFKEREQDVKELDYFDKYVDDVKKADGIVERYKLSEYLAIVAPSGELKRSWVNYHKITQVEYDEFLKEQKEKARLDTIKNPTKEEIQQKAQLIEKIELKNSPLVSSSATTINPRVYIQIANESQRADAGKLQTVLNNDNFITPGIENVGKNPGIMIPNMTEVRYYRDEELPLALRLIADLKTMNLGLKINEAPQRVPGNGRGTRPGHYEIWFSKP
ncbi:hypothetical protein [Chitinophaga sp.]|uniref:hypothetical protein n=1 Tax=Chitinophaga sp. TaxID=1869181 RepID=UPI0031E37B9C